MGGELEAFWRQTPKTFSIFIAGRLKAHEDDHKRIQYQAWLTAKLTGFSDVPDFEDVFKVRRRKASAEHMEAIARQIAASGWGVYTPPPDQAPTPQEKD